MGQIVRLSSTTADYPASAANLGPAESALLCAIRAWVAAYRRGEDPIPVTAEALAGVGAETAAVPAATLMAVIARTVRRQISIHCPRCPNLSDDEKHLLHAASLVQCGNHKMAERALHTALLSAQGAEFALGPLAGIASILASARLYFRRRDAPAATRATLH